MSSAQPAHPARDTRRHTLPQLGRHGGRDQGAREFSNTGELVSSRAIREQRFRAAASGSGSGCAVMFVRYGKRVREVYDLLALPGAELSESPKQVLHYRIG